MEVLVLILRINITREIIVANINKGMTVNLIHNPLIEVTQIVTRQKVTHIKVTVIKKVIIRNFRISTINIRTNIMTSIIKTTNLKLKELRKIINNFKLSILKARFLTLE